MKLRFRTQQTTKLRFFASASALEKSLGQKVKFALRDPGAPLKFPARTLPKGEACKQWPVLGAQLAWLNEQQAERSAWLAGIGGGATLDLAALTASLYRRGMPLVLVPTTLLGMVDATLGGKTAIDGPKLQKNFAGTFYPAQEVWIHAGYLESLPKKERLSGAGEVWKTLWIAGRKASDKALFAFVNGENSDLSKIIKICLKEKLRVVESDPLDTLRRREILNYGHTVGHALESLAHGRLSHGECVLWGMLVESLLVKGPQARLVASTIKRLNLKLPKEFGSGGWERALGADKKAKGGKLQITVLSAPGKPRKLEITAAKLAAHIKTFPKSYPLLAAHPLA
jgi:3-dehydroquinate synthase